MFGNNLFSNKYGPPQAAEIQRTENREQRTENKEQRTKNKEQRTENRKQRTENKFKGIPSAVVSTSSTTAYPNCKLYIINYKL